MTELASVPMSEKQAQPRGENPQTNAAVPTEIGAPTSIPQSTSPNNESFLKATMKGATEAGITSAVATVTPATEVVRPIRIFKDEKQASAETNPKREGVKEILASDKHATQQTRRIQPPVGMMGRRQEQTRRSHLRDVRSELRTQETKKQSQPARKTPILKAA